MLGRKFIGIVTDKDHFIVMMFLDPMARGEDFVVNTKIAELFPGVKPNISLFSLRWRPSREGS